MINGFFCFTGKLWCADFICLSLLPLPPLRANGRQEEIRGESCAWNWELTQVGDIFLAGSAGNPLWQFSLNRRRRQRDYARTAHSSEAQDGQARKLL
jgi:hypothetical protein